MNELTTIGTIEKTVKPELFLEGKEMNLNKSAYLNYKPLLISKIVNSHDSIVLNYSNKEDLNFTLVIDKNIIKVNHKKKLKNESIVNNYIIEYINNIC